MYMFRGDTKELSKKRSSLAPSTLLYVMMIGLLYFEHLCFILVGPGWKLACSPVFPAHI